MAGIMGRSEEARDALAAPPWRRAFFRLPWLIVGLAGSAAATGLMSAFEAELAKSIAIAFFVPAVVYIADAVGTQSEAVAVRGLSLTRGNLWPLLAGEIATGALIGLAIAVLAFPAVGLAFADWNLAGAVAMSVWVASSIATAIGFGLPWLFDRFSIDPALGSGPIATVIQDVLSILVYLLIASWLVLG
jgi:magnesium transporter